MSALLKCQGASGKAAFLVQESPFSPALNSRVVHGPKCTLTLCAAYIVGLFRPKQRRVGAIQRHGGSLLVHHKVLPGRPRMRQLLGVFNVPVGQ